MQELPSRGSQLRRDETKLRFFTDLHDHAGLDSLTKFQEIPYFFKHKLEQENKWLATSRKK